MYAKAPVFLLILFTACASMASPLQPSNTLAPQPTTYKELYREKGEGGSLVYLGPNGSGTSSLAKRDPHPSGYEELYREKQKGGSLLFYGPGNAKRDIEERDNTPPPGPATTFTSEYDATKAQGQKGGVQKDSRSPELHKRGPDCSTYKEEPDCDDEHGARNKLCDQLVGALEDYGDNKVDSAPRQVCFKGDGEKNYCCVSWHNPVEGLIKRDLAFYARKMLAKCTADGVSGKFNGVYLRGVCTHVCLSDRGTHC